MAAPGTAIPRISLTNIEVAATGAGVATRARPCAPSRAWRATACRHVRPGASVGRTGYTCSLPRWVRAGGAGGLPPGPRVLYVRGTRTSLGRTYVPRTVAPQATPASCSSSRTSSPSTCTCSWASSAAKLCRATAGRPRLQLLGRPALCTRRLAASRAGRLSAPLRRDTHGATMVHAPCFECRLHGTCTFQTRVSVIVVGSYLLLLRFSSKEFRGYLPSGAERGAHRARIHPRAA